jgi:O-antigen/teichoic acid export membrane protein
MLFAVGGMGIFHAGQFFAIVLLAKFAPPEVLGQFQFSLAIAAPVLAFCSLELRGALVADAAGEFTFGAYRALRDLMITLAGAALLAVAAWQFIVERNLAYTLILIGMSGGKLVLSQAEVGWGLFQKRERLDLMARSAALRGVAMTAAFGLFVPLYSYLYRRGVLASDDQAGGAALASLAHLLASVLLLLTFDRPRVRAYADHDPTWTWEAVGRLARQTFPLGVVLLLLHLSSSLPQLVMERQEHGREALGFFGGLVNLTLAANLLLFQAANAAANRLANLYQADLAAFLRLAAKMLGLAMCVAIAAIGATLLLGQWFLGFLYRADYAGYYPEFVIIVVAQCLALLTNVFGVLTMQMRLFWLQVPAQLIILLVTTVAALVWIPGAENLVRGGAWTVLARSVVHFALYGGCVLAGILLRPRLLQWNTSRATGLSCNSAVPGDLP